jgi:hypothetical protein
VDDANLTMPLLTTLEEVLVDHASHFSWGKGVQIKGIFDGDNDGRFVILPVEFVVCGHETDIEPAWRQLIIWIEHEIDPTRLELRYFLP